MGLKVFVSYSSKDLPLVERVQHSLEGLDISLFIAEHSVEPGEILPDKIMSAIKSCDLFLLLWSTNSRESSWVQPEIGAAKSQEKPILPIVVEVDTGLPALLAGVKYVSLHDDSGHALENMRQIICNRAENKKNREQLIWATVGLVALFVIAAKS